MYAERRIQNISSPGCITFGGNVTIPQIGSSFSATLVGVTYELFKYDPVSQEFVSIAKLPNADCEPPIFAFSLIVTDDDFTVNIITQNYNHSSISVYPNPFSETITLKSSESSLATSSKTIMLVDLNGNIIKLNALTSLNSNKSSHIINLKHTPTGIYFLLIKEGAKIISHQKIVKFTK